MFGTSPFQIKQKNTVDDGIGGTTETWTDLKLIHGYLDMLSGSDENSIQNAFIEQSTHVLIVPEYIDTITDDMLVVDSFNRKYEITYVDDPVGANHHLELYLKYVGKP